MGEYAPFMKWAVLVLLALPQDPPSDDQFRELHARIVPRADEKWQAIPWKTDLLEARELAIAQGKPVFLWSMNGHPLGCT